jgi:hypothetical protein
MTSRAKNILLSSLLLAGGVALSTAALSQEMPVPLRVQFPLLMKILTFDRNLKARIGSEICIGIVYQKRHRASQDARDDLIRAISESSFRTVEGLPVRSVDIDLGERTNLAEEVGRLGANILYVTPLRAYPLDRISSLSRERRLLTLTGVPEYVSSGLTVGVGERDGKPLILIGLSASRAEGADFSSQLLKLATVIP